jgi:hypothetical protein
MFVTPVLVQFASLLVMALVMLAPVSNPVRASARGMIGCAGLAYADNLALLAQKRVKTPEREP